MTAFDPLDLYDHEIIAIDDVLKTLNAKAQAKSLNFTAFEREIKDRFAEIGLVVSVDWNEFAMAGSNVPVPNAAMPTITPIGRTESRFVFDRDRQVHEVTSNILEIPGEGGVIKADPETYRRFREDNSGHGHGHSH
jgi:hypothetical protein